MTKPKLEPTAEHLDLIKKLQESGFPMNVWVHDWIDSAGHRLVPKHERTPHEEIEGRLNVFISEARSAFDAARDARKATDLLGHQILPLLNEIRGELRRQMDMINQHEKRLDKNEARIEGHANEITAVHRRLDVLEKPTPKRKPVTKRPTRRGKKTR